MRTALVIVGLALALFGVQPAKADLDVTLARAEAPLNGPWAFRLGNDPQWAVPQFNDSSWERVDLTPPPGAHDGDVGIPGYVPGWTARGHDGRWGHAWYRLRVRWNAPAGSTPLLVGPTLVDGAYEIFWNGRRIGGIGDFSTTPPRAFATRPQLYQLPGAGSAGEGVVAIHVYLPKELASEDEAGGIHVAPIMAEPTAGEARHLSQWWQTFWGYVVDGVEPTSLLILALFALSLRRFSKSDPFLPSVALALTAIAALRLNQPLFFWTGVESVRAYNIARYVVLESLATSLWIVACNRMARASNRRLDGAVLAVGVVAGLTALPGLAAVPLHTLARAGLFVLFCRSAAGIARRAPLRLLALPAVLLVAVALFAGELGKLGVPNIWFPFGIGVSRSQFALAFAMPLLAALLHFRTALGSRGSPALDPTTSTSGDASHEPVAALPELLGTRTS